MRTRLSLSHDDAQILAEGCLASAGKQGAAISIAVVDDAGQLLHFSRLDGARAYTVDLAIQKARAAASVAVSTRLLETMAKVPVGGPGGVPVLVEEQCVGAVGISGAQPQVDETIAADGVAALLGGAESG